MKFIDRIKVQAQKNIKTIVLPETTDLRVLEAAAIVLKEKIANIILIGNPEKIKQLGQTLDLTKAKIIDPNTSSLTTTFIEELYELRKAKGLTKEEAKNLITNDNMYFACMLVHSKNADGVVSGACHSTSNTLRPSLQIIKTKPNSELVSAFFLMIVPNCEYGHHGVFVFSDCGLKQNPTSEELASIAKSSAETFKLLTKEEPIVAFLSHSTYGSAKHSDVDKVTTAVKIAQAKYPHLEMDGELQLDAAIIPEIAKFKAPTSKVAGRANVLIFPTLDAGNIGYKLVERLAKAEAYGPITQGINAPINDLSRGCNVQDIVGVIAITVVQAASDN